MLQVSDLSVAYGPIRAVRSVSLSVAEGSLTALIGANGAGKSSLLNAIAGLIKPASGSVKLDGVDVTGQPAHKLVKLGLALVPEGRLIAAPLTVEENLTGCRQRRRSTPEQFQERMTYVYDLFPVLKERRTQYAGSLSGGEQQMLAVSRGLLTAPDVLLLDEPSMGLAPSIVDIVFDAIRAVSAAGQTILLVEQNAELALDICSQAAILQRGEIVSRGTPKELRDSDEFVLSLLG